MEIDRGFSPRDEIRNATKILEDAYAISVIFTSMPD